MKIEIVKKVLVAGAMALPALAVASIADARSIGGFAARAVNASQATYLTENWGTLVMSPSAPSGGVTVELPNLLVDTAASYNPTIGVNSPNSGAVSCTTVAQASINNQGYYQWTGYVQPGVVGTATTFQPGSVSVPNAGFLVVACTLKPGATLYNLYW
jgi:hypothetical protein